MLKSGLNHYITPPFFKSIVPNAPGAASVVFNSKVRQTNNQCQDSTGKHVAVTHVLQQLSLYHCCSAWT